MPPDEATPEIAPNGAFGTPDARPPDAVVDAGPPGVVASHVQATKDKSGAVVPPRSEEAETFVCLGSSLPSDGDRDCAVSAQRFPQPIRRKVVSIRTFVVPRQRGAAGSPSS